MRKEQWKAIVHNTIAWQPIESAPKDGTSIILLVDRKAIEGKYDVDMSLRWESDEWNYITLPSHGCGCCCGSDPAPTHWMPLPNPPTKTE